MNIENKIPNGIASPDSSQTEAINEWRAASSSRRSAERAKYNSKMRRRAAGLVLASASILSPPGQAVIEEFTGQADQDLQTENQTSDNDLPPAGDTNLNDPELVEANTGELVDQKYKEQAES